MTVTREAQPNGRRIVKGGHSQAVSDGVLLDTKSIALAETVWWRVLELTLTNGENPGLPSVPWTDVHTR